MLNGEKGLVRFKFLFSPEYLKEGEKVLFREGSTKLYGQVTRVFTDEDIKKE
jgi:GTPase